MFRFRTKNPIQRLLMLIPIEWSLFMHLTYLALSNFRNFVHTELELLPGPILIHGANAQGKTTILEAINYLATSRSPHASNDRQLLNWHANTPDNPLAVGRLTASVQPEGDARTRKIEIRLIRELGQNGSIFRREVLVNGTQVRRMDLLGNLNAVLFLPQDVALVSAPPSERRRYLDIALCQVNRRYCNTLSHLNKVISQRNALLRALFARRGSFSEMDVWDQQLAELASYIFQQRAILIVELERRAGKIHFDDLTNSSESLRLDYQPCLQPKRPSPHSALPTPAQENPTEWLVDQPIKDIVNALRQVLQASRKMEIDRGISLSGPHRDELRFFVNGFDLGDYGSRGQQRSAILSLKLAEMEWMKNETGERPVLLLDEVLAELDNSRRALLLKRLENGEQAFITATDPKMFTRAFLTKANHIKVINGNIHPWLPVEDEEILKNRPDMPLMNEDFDTQ
ncbi:MAG: DNA replication/repair protein RecF [Anaerolineales bacterium]|nr:DNA replication/repair protein RecF [Anaerolineales bacterium]